MQHSEWVAAVADYSKAIEISSRPNSTKWQNTQTTSSNHFGNSSEITIVDPFTAYAYTSRAAAYIQLREFDLAIADCEKALRIKFGLAAAYLSRGTARRAKGNYDQAMRDYDKALTLDENVVEHGPGILKTSRYLEVSNCRRISRNIRTPTTIIKIPAMTLD